jgi:cellobiose phosphorylase
VERIGAGNAVTLSVDGKKIDGSVVPIPPSGTKEINVQVKLGAAI